MKATADVVVIGTGAGGSVVFRELARAGHDVLALEAGPRVTPDDMTGREEWALATLYHEAGSTTTRDRAIRILQGEGVGGSTVHNQMLAKPAPAEVRAAWSAQGLAELDIPLARATEAIMRELGASVAAAEEGGGANAHNRAFRRGVEALGWRGAPLAVSARGCVGCGYCALGCPYGAKRNAATVFVPSAEAAGGRLWANSRATRLVFKGERVVAVDVRQADPERPGRKRGVRVHTRAVVLAASATRSPTLLRQSGLRQPGIGDGLRLHPGAFVAGDYEEPLYAWRGLPQAWECTEFLDFSPQRGAGPEPPRQWIVPAFAHPASTAGLLPARGAEHGALMRRYAHLGVFIAMLHDHTQGRVRTRLDGRLAIDYRLDPDDQRQLAQGLRNAASIHFAAGAKRVHIPLRGQLATFRRAEELSLLPAQLSAAETSVVAVHPMGTLRMAARESEGPVRPDGRLWAIRNAFVADGSLFPSSIGGPPQMSIYAFGALVAPAVSSAVQSGV